MPASSSSWPSTSSMVLTSSAESSARSSVTWPPWPSQTRRGRPDCFSSFSTRSVGVAPWDSHLTALALSISHDGVGLGQRLAPGGVGAHDLDEPPVARRAAVRRHQPVGRLLLLPDPHQAELYGHGELLCILSIAPSSLPPMPGLTRNRAGRSDRPHTANACTGRTRCVGGKALAQRALGVTRPPPFPFFPPLPFDFDGPRVPAPTARSGPGRTPRRGIRRRPAHPGQGGPVPAGGAHLGHLGHLRHLGHGLRGHLGPPPEHPAEPAHAPPGRPCRVPSSSSASP